MPCLMMNVWIMTFSASPMLGSMNTIKIRHDYTRKCFIAVMNGMESKITYRERPDGTLEYDHTFVPNVLRGQGIAAEITCFALDWARENRKKIHATCPYIVAFLEERRDYEDILA